MKYRWIDPICDAARRNGWAVFFLSCLSLALLLAIEGFHKLCPVRGGR
jgi:hypothetical protein